MSSNPLLQPLARHRYACVFDISSGSIGASVVRYTHNKSPEVFFLATQSIQFNSPTSATSLAASLSKALRKVSLEVIDYIGKDTAIPSHGYTLEIVIHAPWSSSSSARVEKSLQKESTVTKKVLQQFVERNLPDTTAEGYIRFANHITSVELNGYPTANPYNKEAKTIAVTELSSTMAAPVHTALLEVLRDVFPETSPTLRPFIYELINSKHEAHPEDSYLVIDIGDIYTSLKSVSSTTITSSAAVEFGVQDVLLSISDGDSSKNAASASLLSMFLQNTCTPSQCRDIESKLSVAESAWAKNFGDACTQLTTVGKLPTHAYIVAPREYVTWFEHIVERFDFGQFTVTGKELHAEAFSADTLRHALTNHHKTAPNTSLALAILFAGE